MTRLPYSPETPDLPAAVERRDLQRLLSALLFLVFCAPTTPCHAQTKRLGAALNDHPQTLSHQLPLLTERLDLVKPRPESRVQLAHAILVKSDPAKEAVVSDLPQDEVVLIFNDSVGEQYLALAVIDETGKRVDKHDAKLDFSDHSHLRASVAKLNPGKYTVRYRVLSADGHVVSGKYHFQVRLNNEEVRR